MKKLTAFFLSLLLMLSLCSCDVMPKKEIDNTKATQQQSQSDDTEYKIITQIDHCAVEPDDKLHMTDEDEEYYKKLMNAMLQQNPSVILSDSKKSNEFYIDLLRQSPYFFFVDEYKLSGNEVQFSYKYEKDEQDKKLNFIDEKFLNIVNTNASEDDNTLDTILNIHGAVARSMTYDHKRTDNKELDSELFQYPSDEIYKALKTEESLCYGFAYTLRFALLQAGIDCFCVYGPCRNRGEAHMWNIFKYNGKFYTCDSAWDRSDGGYAQLAHFGKTEREREVDSLYISGYSSTFFEEYGEIECTDDSFRMFRDVDRYTFVNTHTYFLETFDYEEYIFDTETFTLE